MDGPVPQALACVIDAVEPRLYRVVRIEKNDGLANALNTLIGQLEDESFVFRMDADDLSDPKRYQAQLDHFTKAPDIDILGTDIVEVDSEAGMRRVVTFSRNPQEARDQLHWRVPVAHPSVCFRRDVLNAVGGYPDVPFNEDVALWFRCAELGFVFGNVAQPLYLYRIDDRFWKRRSYAKAFWEWRCYVEGGMRLNGLSWKLILPTVRLLTRFFPNWLQRKVYNSRLRRR